MATGLEVSGHGQSGLQKSELVPPLIKTEVKIK